MKTHDPAVFRAALSGPPSRWPAVLAGLFALQWIAYAWAPWYRADWALENLLALLTCWWLVRRHRRRPLGTAACALLFVFGSAHELGAHFTYAEVPYDAWSQSLLGFSINELFGTTRNHYDRVVHFLFGLLCYRPLREVLADDLPRRGAASWVLPVAVVMAISGLYEMVEWIAALVFGGELGQAYLGTQGDVWDAQKDSALAMLGALAAGAATLWSGRRHGVSPQRRADVIPLLAVSRRAH